MLFELYLWLFVSTLKIDLLRLLKIMKIVQNLEKSSFSMDNSANTPTSSSNFEEYNIRVFVIVGVCFLLAFAMYCVLAFSMTRATVGQGENSVVAFRKTKTTQHQCRHTCRVNNDTCNAVFNDVSNRNRHEKNDNLHPNCENSTCDITSSSPTPVRNSIK
jgi:hypothetical protein